MLNKMTSYPPTLAVPPIVARAAFGLPLVEDAGGLAARVFLVGQHGQVARLVALQTDKHSSHLKSEAHQSHKSEALTNLTRRVRLNNLI